MNTVPYKYRNVINPWQTPKEIRLAIKFITKMLRRINISEEDALLLLRTNQPDRKW